ncbi:MAG: hypothetical protein ACE5FU_13680 [Nitrospinota bacterium]
MREFHLGKLIKFLIIGFVIMMVLRACTYSTVGGYGPGGHYYGSPGGGFFTGMLLGNMLGGGSIFGGGRSFDSDRSVRRGSTGFGSGRSRSGGFGFGK